MPRTIERWDRVAEMEAQRDFHDDERPLRSDLVRAEARACWPFSTRDVDDFDAALAEMEVLCAC